MLPAYVLVTAARDEAQFIELTIRSVVAQTVRPNKWVIVSDGSIDGTDDIVARYVTDHPWIELVRTGEQGERNFARKVAAFNAGYAMVESLDFDAIGSLDADVSFDSEFFSFLLGKLGENPALGVVGTAFHGSPQYDYRFVSTEHVSGPCQLFRRACFEDVGGYVAMKGGGVDHVAVITARMKGWRTRTFSERAYVHHREMGSARHGRLTARFRAGALDYALGGHPVWELCRAAYQMTRPPYVIGGLMLATGYGAAALARAERPVSRELVAFRRREQMRRLREFFRASSAPSPE
jgi:glycosyltransferase involved in cell wall biosynthesis